MGLKIGSIKSDIGGATIHDEDLNLDYINVAKCRPFNCSIFRLLLSPERAFMDMRKPASNGLPEPLG